ncbi:MAG: fibronectin type III domain-containing protein [Phycisphaerae bacterium]|nr:fibronectin type III domain-containing protein [Saprospiraceae bacterium]
MRTNRLITLPYRPLAVLFYLFLILFLPNNLSAQDATKPVAAWLEGYRAFANFRPVALFQKAQERSDVQLVVGNSSILNLDQAAVAELLQAAPQALRFAIPTADGTIELELAQVEILAPDFFVSTNTQNSVPYQRAIHYRGIVLGNANSVASLSITCSGVMAMVADESGTYQLGQMEDGSDNYVYYKTQNLIALSPNHCFSDEESLMGDDGGQPSSGDRGVGCKTVQIYFECDYKLYTDKGSNTTTVSNYVTSLFNQIATLYANENVGVVISQIYVWTSSDPYVGYNSTSAVLNAFRQTRGTTFNGNLAHLLSTRSLGGGIAYVDVICVKQYAFGVSAITTSFQNVPTYSWTVEVVTHELGHNLGSWHTHSCNWPTGALDNCVNPEGSCSPGPAPVNGGTIMSYCHLTGYGINFNKGFGATPGARIRDKVSSSACVPQSGVVPTGLAASNITSTSATLNWVPVAGATSYTVQYKLNTSGSWIIAGTSTAATYNLSNLTANSAYNWQVKTDCSNYSPTSNFTTPGTGGGNPCNAPSGLGAVSISATSATLIWTGVTGASTYTVQYKISGASNWTTAGNTASVSLVLNNLTAATNYIWQVKANCSVWSATSSFSTPTSGGGGSCDPPSTLNNNTIGSTYAVISWSAVSGATSYTLQIKLANSSDWFTLGAVSVTSVVISGLQPSTSYNWRVKASCSAYSGAKLLTTTANFGGGNGEGNLSQPTLVENNETGGLVLYPNPANEVLNLRFVGEIFQQHQLVVTDAMGRVVSEQTFQSTLAVAAFAPGVYFVNLLEEGRRIATQRFVKM